MAAKENKDGRWPDFFIIGAAKCGTSSVHAYLSRHPSLFMSKIKETEYYSRESVFAKGPEWYRGLFADAPAGTLCGESSTTYSRWPHTPDVPARIFADVPGARFIYILRHPIERTYSHYGHHMREGITMTFEEALAKDDIYVDCSLYMKQIERYLRFFPRERFLFLFHDRFRKDPRGLLMEIERFLGVEERDLTAEGLLFKNLSGADNFVRKHTTRKLRGIPIVNAIAEKMPRMWKEKAYSILRESPVGRSLAARHKLRPMEAETLEKLLDLFEEPNRRLEKFLGIGLPSWREYTLPQPA